MFKEYMLIIYEDNAPEPTYNVFQTIFSDDYDEIIGEKVRAEWDMDCYCELYKRSENGYERFQPRRWWEN